MFKALKNVLRWIFQLVFILTGIFFIRKWYEIKNPLEPEGSIQPDLDQHQKEYKEKEQEADEIVSEQDEDVYKKKVEGKLI